MTDETMDDEYEWDGLHAIFSRYDQSAEESRSRHPHRLRYIYRQMTRTVTDHTAEIYGEISPCRYHPF